MAAKSTTKKVVKKIVKVVKSAVAPKKKTAVKPANNATKKTIKPVAKKKTAAVKKATPKPVAVSKKVTKKDELSKPMAKKTTKKTEKVPKVKEEQKSKTQVQEVQKPVPEKKPIKGYNKKELDHFRSIILEKRDEIIEQLQNLKEQMLDPTTGEYINENSPYSLHMAEQGTDAMEREKIFLYAQRENKFLGYLEDALKRIDTGTYGICIECIDEPQHLCETCPLIPKARLEAVPHSQLCLQIKQKQEKR
jgi:DnaK suppressor protein